MDIQATSFEKLSLSLRFYLQGKGFHKALRAYAIAREHHIGTRKDGLTPELQHQVEVALYVTTLKDLLDEEGTLIAALLHDVQEDYNLSSKELLHEFGPEVTRSIELCNKHGKSSAEFFRQLSLDERASIVKGCDRVHNIQTMLEVFSLDKQKRYAYEVFEHFLPMLKAAAYNFPQQQLAYMNVRQLLKRQLQFVKLIIKLQDNKAQPPEEE